MTTMEVNVQEDLDAVTGQLQKLVEELNKVSQARENLLQQVQNLNGVAMYLRGKLPPEEPPVGGPVTEEENVDKTLERVNEYPTQ